MLPSHLRNRARLNVTCLEDRTMPTPVVTVAVIADATEGNTVGVFRLTRTETDSSLTVNFSTFGTATNGSDYDAPSSVTFNAGAATADINITPTNDTMAEPTETIILMLNSGTGYTTGFPGTATMGIFDNDTTPALAAPLIVDFIAREIGIGLFVFSGRVLDEAPGGLTITFGGGVPTMIGRTTTTVTDGTFTLSVQLQTDGSDTGTLVATTVDSQQLNSNEAMVFVSPSSPPP